MGGGAGDLASLGEVTVPLWFRRDGTPFEGSRRTIADQVESCLRRAGYKVIGDDPTPYGERLSTVWLGLNRSSFFFSPLHRPLIFETILFKRDGSALNQWRYSTEEEAFIGHERMLYQALVPPPLRRFLPGGW